MRKVIDIESSNLLANMIDYSSFPYKLRKDARLWCISIYNIDTKQVVSAKLGECTREWLEKQLADCTELIAHHGCKFDYPALRLFGLLDYRIGYLDEPDLVFGKECKITDTHILSRLFFPDRFGGHSLEVWGERVGHNKINFRQVCVEKGYIAKNAPQGAEFQQYVPEMSDYCDGDTYVNSLVYLELMKEKGNWNWEQAIKVENKLADKAINRETLGFWFDKELAIKHLDTLNTTMNQLKANVEPLLPAKPMNKGELDSYTLPARQIAKDGTPSKFLLAFCAKHDCKMLLETGQIIFEDKIFGLPYKEPLKTHIPATIDNLDHVKMYLISLGWIPTEWKERDLTKDSKKQSISYDKRIKALYKWYEETINGKYTEQRFSQLDVDRESLLNEFSARLRQDKPVRVPTSPSVRVGLEKELCPNLTALGDKVAFAKDFALYLTYKHRRNSIAGGDTEDMDFDFETPNTGYLSMYREQDGRVSTPSIEIGASTNRYRHIGIANIPRATSVFGKEMRSLFGCGPNAVQLGFDFSSLEARIQGHYCLNYTNGEALTKMLLAEKPNDWHSVVAKALGMSRTDVKSFNYAILYGAQIAKIMKMLSCSRDRATELYNGFWESNPALKELRDKVELYWEATNRKYVLGIDGRKIFIRSKHSILNALFQSAGVISTKYVTIMIYQMLEEQGYCTDPFIGKPDACSMIEYHDEAQFYLNPKLAEFKTFATEDEAKSFIKEWKNTEQLSTINEGTNGYYITLPNILSTIIDKSIKQATEILKLNVPLGYEWCVNKTWYGCH